MTWVSRSGSARRLGTRVGQVDDDLRPALAEELGGGADGVGDERAQVDIGRMPLGGAGLDLGEVEHLVDEPGQPLALRDDDAEELLALCGLHVGGVEHQLGEGADRGERRAKLVGDRGHEVVLQVVEALQLLVGRAQLGRGLLERAGVAAQLRGFVEDLEDVVDRQRLLLRDRLDQHPGGGGADGAGDLALDPVYQPGVGDEIRHRDPDLAGVLVEEGAGAGRAEEAAGERAQVGEPGAAAPEDRLGAAAAEDVDEEQRLARLAGGGAAERARGRRRARR